MGRPSLTSEPAAAFCKTDETIDTEPTELTSKCAVKPKQQDNKGEDILHSWMQSP